MASIMGDTSVARALRCRDIQLEIFEQMSVPWFEDDPFNTLEYSPSVITPWRHTLASSARVCRAFSELALDILWRTLDDIDVLFKILPSLTRTGDMGHHWTISEEITHDEWSHLQQYARRVRVVRGVSALGKLHSTVWAFVDSVRQDQPLLPKLCHLKLAVPVDSAAAYLRLLSPSLRHLKIAFLPSRDFALVGALTSLIASKLPRLQTLCVDSGLRAVPARYLTALSRLQQLQTLDLEASGVSLPFSVLKLILQNTTLRALYALIIIDHMGEEDLDFGDNLLELQDISLNGCAQDLVWFFAHARLLNLSEFRVVMNGTPTELSISNALSSICGDLPRTLTSFCLYFNEPQIERSPPLSSAELFQPMLAFQDLTNIDIEFDAPTVSLSDQDAETFATAFPNLDSFRLVSSVRGADQHEVSQPTIAALVSFAKHCPALRVLNFASLDVRTCPSPLSIPAVGHASLKYLSFSRLLGGGNANLLDLAVIVDRLFPNIDTPRSATVRAIISSRSATVDNDGLGVPYGVPGRLAFRESRREATLDSEASRMLRFFLGAVQRGRKPVDDGCYPHEDSDTSESPVPDEGLVEPEDFTYWPPPHVHVLADSP